ncbi:MAG: sugar-transfer associated ATP-grasp domain-containing protein [Vicinamibacterales bacterium]
MRPRLWAAARAVYHLARNEELRAPFSLRHKLTWWPRGFRADTAAVYDLAHHDWHDYVSDYARVYRCVNINPARAFFDQKLMLRAFLLARGFPQPETIALFERGHVLLNPLSGSPESSSIGDLQRRLLDDGGRFIVKPEGTGRGKGVFLVTARDGRLVRQRGPDVRPFTPAGDDRPTIVERMIEQGAFWRELCPFSANTLRVVTMWTPGDAAPFIGVAVQRIGTAATMPTDNWSGGGICARVDVTTGRMGIGRMHPLKGGRRETDYARHPDSGAQIQGVELPDWQTVCDAVLRAAIALPTSRYIGWDVFVDDDGRAIIGEGSANTDVNLLQVHGGLLVDPAVRRFYETCGTI